MLNQLKNIGLSENEAKVYMAMLELGPSTMLQIAGKAGINRPTAYAQLESLKKRGLVSMVSKGKKSLFAAEAPNQLESMLEREEKDIELKKEELGRVLPDLATMYNLGGEKPVVRFFEGIEGLMKMQDEFLKSKEKMIYAIAAMDDVLKVFPNQKKAYAPRRVAKGIRSKMLYTSSAGVMFPPHDEQMLRETKFVSPDKLPFSADITIWDDHVAITSVRGKLSGVIITHPEIANSFKNLFNLLWVAADKI